MVKPHHSDTADGSDKKNSNKKLKMKINLMETIMRVIYVVQSDHSAVSQK